MFPKHLSISARLILGATFWCVLAVLVTGVVLVQLFARHIEHEFDSSLENDLVHLVANTALQDGRIAVLRGAFQSRYEQPFSGWAWQVRDGQVVLAQSGSLGPAVAGFAEVLTPPIGEVGQFSAPGNIPSRGLSREVRLKGTSRPLLFAIARPADTLVNALRDFRQVVALVLSVLALGLVATVFLLMRIGLSPLRDLRSKVQAMRTGQKAPDTPVWPAELAPVASELDDLESDIDRLVSRARTSAADLAHAVKTPLATLKHLVTGVDTRDRQRFANQIARIDDYLNRYLSQSRAAGTGTRLVSVKTTVEDILAALAPETDRRGLNIKTNVPATAMFRGDEVDLYELVGSLLDNAVKWARSAITVEVGTDGSSLQLLIEDDGPGIPETERGAVFVRGRRLDETAPGQGLGLSIVADLVDLYRGKVSLEHGASGGCLVRLELPGNG